MRAAVKTWSAQETELAETLVAQKADNETCLATLGRTLRCVESRIYRLRNIAGNVRKTGLYAGEGKIQIPPEVLEDRNRRLMAQYLRSPAAQIMGDPIPGFSALDGRT